MRLSYGSKIKVFDENVHIVDTFTLIKDNDGYELMSDGEKFTENWNIGLLMDKDYSFEIVEDNKIPENIKKALNTLGDFCNNHKLCYRCPFYNDKISDETCCKLKLNNPFVNMEKFGGK